MVSVYLFPVTLAPLVIVDVSWLIDSTRDIVPVSSAVVAQPFLPVKSNLLLTSDKFRYYRAGSRPGVRGFTYARHERLGEVFVSQADFRNSTHDMIKQNVNATSSLKLGITPYVL